ARHAGNDTWRDAALSDLVSLINLVLTRSIRRNQFTAVDGGMKIKFTGIDAQPAFGEKQIAEYNAWALEAVGYIEDLRDQLEAVGNVERRGDNPGIITEGCAQHLPEVALLSFGGNAGGWTSTLAINDYDGNLRLSGEAEAFTHKRESAT